MDHTHGHRAHVHTDHAAPTHAAGRGRRLWLAFGLTTGMLLLEAVGGLASGSLALLTDAAHMLVDALALLMAVVAAWMARRPADARRSYGYARIEVLSGFTSGVLQVLLIIFILVEAVERLWHPQPIRSGLMLGVAVAGLVVNLLVLRTLHHHEPDDVNMGAAALHVLGDVLGSVAAVLAAVLVGWLGWLRADPALSILVSLLILASARVLLRRSAHILLEGVPEDLETGEMLEALRRAHADIYDVHHLHVWQLASGSRMATVHVRTCTGSTTAEVMHATKQVLSERFAVSHTTVQIEPGHCPDDADGPRPR